jgi:hypothetical protein
VIVPVSRARTNTNHVDFNKDRVLTNFWNLDLDWPPPPFDGAQGMLSSPASRGEDEGGGLNGLNDWNVLNASAAIAGCVDTCGIAVIDAAQV